ncbi:hypothetical protein E3N88_36045 [Mikania micrantha]|uniref:Uncharacterized protein n=1 Tax=Mikania micrantha TaxID=192012 RepID=A0A5N6M2N5_9ASTR|nr:hypothetical protein E3N88_36045 [Mikania micrantha]
MTSLRPVDDEDLIVHITNQFNDDFKNLAAALKTRDSPISYSELFAQLVDHERWLKETSQTPLISTVNNTQSHVTKECRKLARFLQEHQIINHPVAPTTPTVNTSSTTSANTHSWMWDTGASNNTANNQHAFPVLSEYGGPDEILQGSMHKGTSHAGSERQCCLLWNILLITSSQLHQNRIPTQVAPYTWTPIASSIQVSHPTSPLKVSPTIPPHLTHRNKTVLLSGVIDISLKLDSLYFTMLTSRNNFGLMRFKPPHTS